VKCSIVVPSPRSDPGCDTEMNNYIITTTETITQIYTNLWITASNDVTL